MTRGVKMLELIVSGILIPIVAALIYMLKREVDKSERHDKWMVEQNRQLMENQKKLTLTLENHFKTEAKMQGRTLRSLRVFAKNLSELNKLIKN